MTDEEIQQALLNDKNGQQAALASGFKRYFQGDTCPDGHCPFYLKEHYHCVRPRCHHCTDRVDVLNLHAKDFHSYINLLEGFEYFDPRVDCRRPHCHNNRANKHFHCTRPRCDYSFVRYSTMAQHDKKHRLADLSKELSGPQMALPKSPLGMAMNLPASLPPNIMQQIITASQTVTATAGQTLDKDGNVIKTKGTFYPVTNPKGAHGDGQGKGKSSSNLVNIAPKPAGSLGLPLTVLLQQKATNVAPQLDWITLCMKMHYGQMQNCGRPFCKLKKKDHYHCYECSQAFSDPERLKMHISKHGIKLEKYDVSGVKRPAQVEEGLDMTIKKLRKDEEEEPDPSSSLNLNPSTFSKFLNPQYMGQKDEDSDEEGQLVMDLKQEEEEETVDEEELDDEDGEDEESSRFDSMCDEDSRYMGNAEESRDMSVASEQDESVDLSTTGDYVHENGNGHFETKPEVTDSFLEADAEDNVSFSRHSGRKRTAPKHNDFVDTELATKQHRAATVSPPKAKEKDENLPEGYIKYKFTEDCAFDRCAYRLANTHYHCMRTDCGFSFSDRSRLPQHQQRHERYDALMGDEFTQFRLHHDCDRPDCQFSKKASHFHCQRCEFACTDSSKVMAHRKQHEKMDSIASLGFERVTGTTECPVAGCVHSMKQTHYHCLTTGCQQAVLGPSMMQAHQQKHNVSMQS